MSIAQRYRLRTPSTGREIIIEAEPGKVYRDRDTGAVSYTHLTLPTN